MFLLAGQKDKIYAQTLANIAKEAGAALWTAKQFEEELNLTCAQIFLCQGKEEKEPFGFVCFRVYQEEAELTNFAILPQKQNKHFGTKLLAFALKNLLERGVKKITLEVSTQNLKAKKIYQDFGFKKVAIRKKFYEGEIDAELMLFTA
ncbi:MAG: GNAT family N-acetyltransferase [Elusimicrobiaceae bacterium]|nr:GNAT family N-acetyltransferase [Elusimicrobiaceae bacterium]MBQ6224056.1 GNAT family N-acetyltransferase [Campylobacter sp.]